MCMVYSVRRERQQRIQAAKASSSTAILDADIGVRNELIGCRLAKGLQSLSPDFLRAVVKICYSAKKKYRIELRQILNRYGRDKLLFSSRNVRVIRMFVTVLKSLTHFFTGAISFLRYPNPAERERRLWK